MATTKKTTKPMPMPKGGKPGVMVMVGVPKGKGPMGKGGKKAC